MVELSPIKYLENMPKNRNGYVELIFDQVNESAILILAKPGSSPLLAYVTTSNTVRVSKSTADNHPDLLLIQSSTVDIDKTAQELPSWLYKRSDSLYGKPIKIYRSKDDYRSKLPSRIVRITNGQVTIEKILT